MRHRLIGVLTLALLPACAGSRGAPSSPDGSNVDLSIAFPDGCIRVCAGKSCGDPDGCGGLCDGACPAGQVCQAGTCTCTAQSCGSGCCQADACFPGTADDHCGGGGAACSDCLAQSQSCGAQQSCFACTPDCSGKACGAANGCGGTCSTGSCPTGQVCSGGQCVCTAQSCPTGCCDLSQVCQPGLVDGVCGVGGALCQDCSAQSKQCSAGACKDCARWSTTLPADLKDLVVDTDGTIYVAGKHTGNKIYLAALDGCGTVLRSTSHLPTGAATAAASSLALVGNDLFVGGVVVPSTGGDPQQGLYGRFPKQTLAAAWTKVLTGSTGKDEVWDLAYAGGAIWMSGTSGFDTTASTWGVKGAVSSASACGFELAGTGNLRNITAPPGSGYVYFTGIHNGVGLVARLSDTACAVSPCSACPASWQQTFQDGTSTTEGRGILVIGGNVYVAGYSAVSGQDLRALVVRIDLATGAVQNSYTWNPTTLGDIFLDLATDGTSLYVAGLQGYDGTTAQAAVQMLSMPALTKVWSAVPDAGAYWSVKTVGSDGLLLAGNGGIVRRCLTSGVCP